MAVAFVVSMSAYTVHKGTKAQLRCFRVWHWNRTLYLILAIGIWIIGGDCHIAARAMKAEVEGNVSTGASFPDSKEDSFAEMIDRALEIEFADKDQPDVHAWCTTYIGFDLTGIDYLLANATA
eukprot:Gb_19621 [translate_table: standard]